MSDSSDTAERGVRPLRSFVLREGRLTAAQHRALTELWPQYGLTPEGTLDFRAIFGREAPVWLEIGFGNGEALHHMAGLYPEIDFVGIEVHRPGVGRLLNAVERDGLTNVRVICADAAEVIRGHVARGSLERILVFFPDPWPKKRHHKRRLIQPAFAAELVRALRPGGMLHLATDWADYAEHMQAVLNAEPGLENTADGGVQRPEYRPRTRFELRGVNKGHAVTDLLYRTTA